MSINKELKKVGVAVTLASMISGVNSQAFNVKSGIIGALAAAAAFGIADAGFNKNPWGPVKEKANAPEGLYNKWFNKAPAQQNNK